MRPSATAAAFLPSSVVMSSVAIPLKRIEQMQPRRWPVKVYDIVDIIHTLSLMLSGKLRKGGCHGNVD
jgi:hypothetical protein